MLKKAIKKLLFKISFFGTKECLLIGTPAHQNLGDAEIAYAERKYLQDNKISFFEITTQEYLDNKDTIINNKQKYKTILLHGGGNIGDEYLNEENIRRDIIKNFLDKKIIIMPQTIFFTNTVKGKKELENTKEVYNNHPNLQIIAREKKSYDFAKKHFKNVYLTPDIVLYLRKEDITNANKDILFLLRNDSEKILDDKKIKKIFNTLDKEKITYEISDMMYEKNINKYLRKKILNKKHNQIKNFNVVITDRLHGMVFSYLNSKKCVALSNYNYKVKGTYEWIKKDKTIMFFDNIDELDIKTIKNLLKSNYDNNNYINISSYDVILNLIKEK